VFREFASETSDDLDVDAEPQGVKQLVAMDTPPILRP
jgi:hypothetical protein